MSASMSRPVGIMVRAVVIVMATSLVFTACGGGETSEEPGSDATDAVVVDIADFAFSESEITISAGTTVRWVNREASVSHTSTSGDGVWDSGALGPGDEFGHTFSEPGTFSYLCSFHPTMRGTVIVEG